MKTYAILSLFILSMLALGEFSFANENHHSKWLFGTPFKTIAKRHRIPTQNWLTGQDLPTVAPATDAPQSLGELHERASDALAFALGRSQELPSLNFNVSSDNGANNTQIFATSQAFALPEFIPISTGEGNDYALRLRLIGAEGTATTCFYKAKKSSAYEFDYCIPAEAEAFCAINNASHKVCKATANLGIEAGNTVVEKSISVSMQKNSCGKNCRAVPVVALMTLKNFNDACGGLALSSVHLLEDLNCPVAGHVGMELVGEGNKFYGHGHAINAPNVLIGLFVTGDKTGVHGISVSNVAGGYGFMSYNANGLILRDSRFRANLVGVNIYTDAVDSTKIQIFNNDISANAFAGLIMNGDGKRTDNPLIAGNNFANTGGYAIVLSAKNATLTGKHYNEFTGSKSVMFLSGGDFTLKSLDLSSSGASGPQIFVDSAESITIKNADLSYSGSGSNTGERVALHMYRVSSASVSGLVVNGSDVAVKVATEQGTETAFRLRKSKITNSVTAAIMLQSYDSTPLGVIKIRRNDLSSNPAGYAVWQVGSTTLGAGSVINGNTQ